MSSKINERGPPLHSGERKLTATRPCCHFDKVNSANYLLYKNKLTLLSYHVSALLDGIAPLSKRHLRRHDLSIILKASYKVKMGKLYVRFKFKFKPSMLQRQKL